MTIRHVVLASMLADRIGVAACTSTALASASPQAAQAAASQQPTADRVTVPLSDPSRPALIDVSLVQGSITVRGSNRKDVLVTARPETDRPSRRYDPDATGMRRIPQTAGFRITEDGNRIKVGVGQSEPFHHLRDRGAGAHQPEAVDRQRRRDPRREHRRRVDRQQHQRRHHAEQRGRNGQRRHHQRERPRDDDARDRGTATWRSRR